MSLKKELASIRDNYVDELNTLITFFETIEKSLKRKLKKKKSVRWTDNDDGGPAEIIIDNSARQISDDPLSDAINIVLSDSFTQIRNLHYLSEMGLSYLVSFLEAILKDYLYQIFVHRPSSLKSENKITYKKVLSYRSMKVLVEEIATKEVEKLGYGSIDDAAEYYKEKFNINFTEYEDWDPIVEACFRRNLIIHNKGITNEIYCKRIGHKKRGEKLFVDIEYIKSLGENLIGFSEFCYISFTKVFKFS